jgi:hypothetical protein
MGLEGYNGKQTYLVDDLSLRLLAVDHDVDHFPAAVAVIELL